MSMNLGEERGRGGMLKMAIVAAVIAGAGVGATYFGGSKGPTLRPAEDNTKKIDQTQTVNLNDSTLATAVFAGGCFWCTEVDFEKVDGVVAVISGYTGGTEPNPTYEDVSWGRTSHIESVKVYFKPSVVSYDDLLRRFWMTIDPTDPDGQFVDKGSQYRSAIFYSGDMQRKLAEASLVELKALGVFQKPIVTMIRPLTAFYPAEEYHQDFYKKDPTRYKSYRSGSGRDEFTSEAWEGFAWPDKSVQSMSSKGSERRYTVASDQELKKKLTPIQYEVARENGTEPPFQNEFWDNKKEGIYVDIVSGEPLFSSIDKFNSGTGWPSFTRPLVRENVVEKTDASHFMVRTEVRSKNGDSHLGHLFDDGPAPTGLRYCINSASLRFIPKEKLEAEGYGEFTSIFKK